MRKELRFFIFLFFLFATTIKANDTSSIRKMMWWDEGFGFYGLFGGSSEPFGGLSLYTSFNYSNKEVNYKLRAIGNLEFNLFGPTPSEYFTSIGCLIGKAFLFKKTIKHFSIGLGITGGRRRGNFLSHSSFPSRNNYENDYFLTPSIPFEAGLVNTSISYFGFGVNLFGDLNIKRSYAGLTFLITIGTPRSKVVDE